MDRAVIEGDPHRVLEGMAIAAYAHRRHARPTSTSAPNTRWPSSGCKTAIAQAKAYGLLGENILDSGFNLDIIIKMGAGAFVCGEETALIHSIEGKRGMPRPRPPFPAVSGLFGKPTVINNVETLANVPAHRAATAPSGSRASARRRARARRSSRSPARWRARAWSKWRWAPRSARSSSTSAAASPTARYKAVQIGGPSGGCIPEQHLDIEIDYESLKTVGAMMGSGGLVVMDEDTCMVDVAKFFMDFIQRESCGKCIPCREGTRRMLEILQSASRAAGAARTGIEPLERFQSVMYLEHLAEIIRDTSLCGLGQSAPNPVLSTLRWFRDEYEAHVYERRCPAEACTELLHYTHRRREVHRLRACARRTARPRRSSAR